MTSNQFHEGFQLLAEYLFTYFQRAHFQTRSSSETRGILSVASHHGGREFSTDFYYKNIRISTDLKRTGNQAILKMESNQINLNRTLAFNLAQDVRLENGELKFRDQNNVNNLNDLISHIRTLINDTASSSSGDGARSNHLFSSGINSSAAKHTYEPGQSSAELINPIEQHPYQIQSLVNAQTDASNSTMNLSFIQLNMHFNQRPYQRQANEDNFEMLLQSMHDVANSQSHEIPFDSSTYGSILNELTGPPSDNAAFDQGASSNNNHDHEEATLD